MGLQFNSISSLFPESVCVVRDIQQMQNQRFTFQWTWLFQHDYLKVPATEATSSVLLFLKLAAH